MTQDKTSHLAELAILERLLASHGADRTRWPAPERLRLANLLANSEEAKRLLKETAALDRLLDLAPQPGPERTKAAARRIGTAITGAAPARVASIQGKAVTRGPERRGWLSSVSRATGYRGDAAQAMAAGLLAASLLIGAFAGSSGALNTVLEPFTEEVADDNDSAVDATQLALGADAAGLVEEERL